MKLDSCLLIALLLVPGTVLVLSNSDAGAIIEIACPVAKITEIE